MHAVAAAGRVGRCHCHTGSKQYWAFTNRPEYMFMFHSFLEGCVFTLFIRTRTRILVLRADTFVLGEDAIHHGSSIGTPILL